MEQLPIEEKATRAMLLLHPIGNQRPSPENKEPHKELFILRIRTRPSKVERNRASA